MSKRRPPLLAGQYDLFDVPARVEPAGLAGLDRVVAAKVAKALKADPRDRYEIAGAMSSLLAEPVSKEMLDAYAADARKNHNISVSRFFALIAVTEQFELLDGLARRIGAAVLIGEELKAARLGSLRAQKRQLDEEIKKIERDAVPIARGNR